MRQVVVYALYAWCAISLIAVIVHQVKRRSPSSEVGASSTTSSKLAAEDGSSAGVGGELLDPDTSKSSVEPDRLNLKKPSEQATETATKPEPDTVEVPAMSTISAKAATSDDVVPPTDLPLGESAPTAATPMAAADAATSDQPVSKGLAELLAGISLPHDLLPVIPDRADIDENRVSLLTSSAPVDVVGPAVADELERLGYSLEPLTESELGATRGDDSLKLEIVTSPATAEHGGRLLYPQAKDGDVVITIEAT